MKKDLRSQIKELQATYTAMLEEVEYKLAQAKKILRKKYGLEGNFDYNSKEYAKYANELDKVEGKILNQYHFYTGYEEELHGVDLAFKYLLKHVKEEE